MSGSVGPLALRQAQGERISDPRPLVPQTVRLVEVLEHALGDLTG
jgi:hypothetical protein